MGELLYILLHFSSVYITKYLCFDYGYVQEMLTFGLSHCQAMTNMTLNNKFPYKARMSKQNLVSCFH